MKKATQSQRTPSAEESFWKRYNALPDNARRQISNTVKQRLRMAECLPGIQRTRQRNEHRYTSGSSASTWEEVERVERERMIRWLETMERISYSNQEHTRRRHKANLNRYVSCYGRLHPTRNNSQRRIRPYRPVRMRAHGQGNVHDPNLEEPVHCPGRSASKIGCGW